MAGKYLVPADQGLFADAPGAPVRDEAAAGGSGTVLNATLSVTFVMETITGSATLAYHLGGGDTTLYSETDSGNTGSQTQEFPFASVDLSVFTLVAKAASAVDPCEISVTAWSFSYGNVGLIVEA